VLEYREAREKETGIGEGVKLEKTNMRPFCLEK